MSNSFDFNQFLISSGSDLEVMKTSGVFRMSSVRFLVLNKSKTSFSSSTIKS